MSPLYGVRADYEPRAQVSPSSIKLARMCERAWGFRYVLGYKEPELPWSAFLPGGTHAARPPKDTPELKAWNRLRRPALGKAIHGLLEDWYAQRPVDWHSEPGKILLPALMYFPHPKNCAVVTEEKLPDAFVAQCTDGKHNYEFNAYIDVNGLDHDPLNWRLLDLKTTSSFDWAAKPDELVQDTQGIIYPLYVMQKYAAMRIALHASTIIPRWVYTLTEGEPKARAVDFRVTYDGAMRRALPLFDEGAALVQKINDRADPNSLTPNVAACDMYHRKCIYHHSVGGPCKAESSPGKMARALLVRGSKQERTIMAFNLKKPAGAAESPAAEKEVIEAAGEGAVEQTGDAEQTAEQTRKRRGRPAAAASAAVLTEAPGATVTFADGNVFAVPAASPISGKLNAIHAALFGE